MARLGDLQFAGLIDEIACAMRSGIPVESAMRRLQTSRLGRIGRVAGSVADQLDRGRSLSDAIDCVSSPVTTQVQVAITAAEKSGDHRLISRIAEQLRRRNQYIGVTRIAYFYPILLAMIAYGAMVLVAAPLVRQNEGRDFQWSPWLVTSLAWLEQNYWIPPLIALAIAFLIWVMLRARSPMSKHARRSLFFLSLADQIRGNVAEHDAISSAARMSGDLALARIENPTLDSPAVARLIGKSDEISDIDRSEDRIAAAPSRLHREPSILVARLYYLGARHAEAARRDAYFWSRVVPRGAMILIGCGFVFSYAWWVIAPVYRQVAQW